MSPSEPWENVRKTIDKMIIGEHHDISTLSVHKGKYRVGKQFRQYEIKIELQNKNEKLESESNLCV